MPNVMLAVIALFVTVLGAFGATDYFLALIGAPVLATIAVLLAAAIVLAPIGAGLTPPPGWESQGGR